MLVYGNPFDGLHVIGPFEDAEDAGSYGEWELKNEEWWIVPLEPKKAAGDD